MQASLLPIGKQQFFDSNGDPLSGGKIYFYETGTTTLKDVYSSSSATIPLSNPVVLDSSGRAEIWIDGFYTMKVYTSTDVLVYSVDNISSQYYTGGASSEWIDFQSDATYVSTTQFSVVGNYATSFEVGRRIKAVFSGATYYGTITAVSVAGSPVVTTVTVDMDTTPLADPITSVSYAILSSSNISLPTIPVATKSANYTLLQSDYGKTIILSGNATMLTLPAANAVPTGFKFEFLNVGSNAATVVGTVNGCSNRHFLQYESANIFSDGNAWRGLNLQNDAPIGTIRAWHKSLGGVPQVLPFGWVEMTGQTISDAESPLNGSNIANLQTDRAYLTGSNVSGDYQNQANATLFTHLHYYDNKAIRRNASANGNNGTIPETNPTYVAARSADVGANFFANAYFKCQSNANGDIGFFDFAPRTNANGNNANSRTRDTSSYPGDADSFPWGNSNSSFVGTDANLGARLPGIKVVFIIKIK